MSLDTRELIFECSSFAEKELSGAREVLERFNVVALRGLVTQEEVAHSLELLKETFKRDLDNPTIGEDPKDIQSNFQKLLVGTHNHSGLRLSRLFRTFYNPMWSEDCYQLHETFLKMIKVRNYFCNLPEEFATHKIEKNGLWSATRIHQYPIGGGHFAGHQDSVLTDVSNKEGTEFYQVILNMTQVGREFDQGGAFVKIDDQLITFESCFSVGDIIVYNENTFHGVEEIDPHKNLDLETFNGRVTAFVSLYKNLV